MKKINIAGLLPGSENDILHIQRSASPTTTIALETEETTFMEYQPTGTNPTTAVTPMLETEETTFTTLTTGTLPDWDDWDFTEQASTQLYHPSWIPVARSALTSKT